MKQSTNFESMHATSKTYGICYILRITLALSLYKHSLLSCVLLCIIVKAVQHTVCWECAELSYFFDYIKSCCYCVLNNGRPALIAIMPCWPPSHMLLIDWLV